jgi:hypothetical protein
MAWVITEGFHQLKKIMSEIMQGNWNHSKKPSEYEVFDSDGELLYSGAFVDAMKYMEEKKMEIMDDYDAGFADATKLIQEKLDAILFKYKLTLKEYDYIEEARDVELLEEVKQKLFEKV